MTLTSQQQKVFDYVVEFRADHGVAPTVREIGDHLGVTLSTAAHHIDWLVGHGVLEKQSVPGQPGTSLPRGLRPVMKAETETL